ncbi:MAG: TIM44-like domain-containing protein [Solirubrobacteraceae bacterium]
MTPRGRRIALAAAIVAIAAVLIGAPDAFGAAGGGSHSFGGGGGEGGGGGGGGRGVGIYILFQILIRIAVLGHGLGALVLIALALIWFVFTRTSPTARGFWSARQRTGRAARNQAKRRERRVQLAAAEAAEDDEAFAPDVVKPAAATLFTDIQAAWDADDRQTLHRLVSPELLTEWEHRLDDFKARGWRNRVQPIGSPNVEYVGLTNRSEGDADRVIVRIEAKVRDYVVDRNGKHIKSEGQFGETRRLREFWTLRRRGSRWILASIEQGAEGSHALQDEIVASPWADEQSMRDEALVEGAVADAVPQGTKIAEVADLQFEGDARAAALDLSLADGRFAPDVLEVAARRAVAAWAEAVDGSDAALTAIAHPEAAKQLLHPGDPSAATRLVVRGPRVKQIRIGALDAGATPPTMTVEVDVAGRRYIENRRTTEVLAGSQSRETSFTEHWMFALDGPAQQPWRIAATGAPLARA